MELLYTFLRLLLFYLYLTDKSQMGPAPRLQHTTIFELVTAITHWRPGAYIHVRHVGIEIHEMNFIRDYAMPRVFTRNIFLLFWRVIVCV